MLTKLSADLILQLLPHLNIYDAVSITHVSSSFYQLGETRIFGINALNGNRAEPSFPMPYSQDISSDDLQTLKAVRNRARLMGAPPELKLKELYCSPSEETKVFDS
jgi:hypothetical protein